MRIQRSCLLFLFLGEISAKPIDNGLTRRQPEVECREGRMEISFDTKKKFQGRIFVQGHDQDDKCILVASTNPEQQVNVAILTLDTKDCNVTIRYSKDPPGLFYSTRIVVSFHRLFITKVDKVYDIHCFFMETDKEKLYTMQVRNTAAPTDFTQIQMPACDYAVTNPTTGFPATIANVGDKLKHTWSCIALNPDLWCMRVHSCLVQGSSGAEIAVVDEDGCANDRFLFGNLEYSNTKALLVTKEAFAFRFAQRTAVSFKCAIRLSVKRKEDKCPRPKCDDSRRRFRRLSAKLQDESATEVKVESQRINILEPQIDFGLQKQDAAYQAAIRSVADQMRHANSPYRSWFNRLSFGSTTTNDNDCVPRVAILVSFLAAALSTGVSLLVCVLPVWRRLRNYDVEHEGSGI